MRMRATSTAILLFMQNMLGYGLGPLFAGYVSDLYFNADLAKSGFGGAVTRTVCDAAQEGVKKAGGNGIPLADALAALKRPISEAQFTFCNVANQDSTQASMLTITVIYALGAVFFLVCSLRLKKDLEAS
jgi:hypothetical protein